MQPGVTVVLAMVWLAMYANVVGTASHHPSRLTLDQYSPLAPHRRHHEVYRGTEDELDWKDQNHAENQPFDLSIGPRRSISMSAIGSQEQSSRGEYLGKDPTLRWTGNSVGDDFSTLVEDKQSRKFASHEFTDRIVDGRGTKGLESASRELSPPSELEDPFVADDTFQDQGPGSVEIYKLDLLREKSILSPTPIIRFLSQAKSKAPKKTSDSNWKAKTMEYKATSPKMFYKQSNSFDDSSTEVPPNNDPFSIGGVPELQVGCEGLEASDHNKQKRSIDTPGRDQNLREIDPWTDVTPISLDLDYDLSGEEGYEEMDELVKLKKFETTTKKGKPNRGDMEATLHSEFFDDKRGTEKLPVRGDLGKSSVNSSGLPVMTGHDNRKAEEKVAKEGLHFDRDKRDLLDETNSADGLARGTNQRRKILWFDDSDITVQLESERRSKRGIWGFGENEGVVSSDELQTANQRRRQENERRRKEEEERRLQLKQWRRRDERWRHNYIGNQTNSDIEKIREEYERSLEHRQRQEEERQRRLQQESQTKRWQMEEEHRRRKEEEESRRNRWTGEERRMQEAEALRRRHESRPQSTTYEVDQKRQRQQEEEIRRREENRLREEERRQRMQAEEEDRRRRQQEEEARRTYEDRKREWLKKKQEEETERRRQQQNRNEPSNLVYPQRPTVNESRPYDEEAERRLTDHRERERQRKLNEYIQRNRPINVTSPIDQQREEENRRKLEEQRRRLEQERKLQEYIRRNQPVHVSRMNVSHDRNWQEHRRRIDEAKQYDSPRSPGSRDGRRNHGPSAPTNIDPRDYVDEAKRREATRRIEEERIRERQREQQEQLRREALRREEEDRRIQSKRYEEERERLEAARLQAERRENELREAEERRNQAGRKRPLEDTRPRYEDRRRLEQHRRRQDTSLIPANLLSNQSRRAMELERQRQEQERWRLEAERRRHEDSRTKEERENEHRSRAMKEQWRRQEEARLNALPVSARIIVRPVSSSSSPNFVSRTGSDIDIDYQGANPYRPGVPMPNFPASATQHPPVQSPPPCVWAVVHCCTSNINRLVRCFESNGCPGVNWDPNPCRVSITQAARAQVSKFYADTEAEEERRF